MTGWEPQQYNRFARERAAPLEDLLALARPAQVRRLVDLGCGPGEGTARAASALGATTSVGIDSSPEMLGAAAAHAGEGIRFETGDLATWTSAADIDVVLAAASLQWVPDHAGVLERWTNALAPGGQLLVHVPANAHAATHVVAHDLANREQYRSAFGVEGPPPDPVGQNVLSAEGYARLLHDLEYEDQAVSLRIYPHLLASAAEAVEWVKGTTLTRFASRLPLETYERFLADYQREVIGVLGAQRPLFFPFPRILIWGRRPR